MPPPLNEICQEYPGSAQEEWTAQLILNIVWYGGKGKDFDVQKNWNQILQMEYMSLSKSRKPSKVLFPYL